MAIHALEFGDINSRRIGTDQYVHEGLNRGSDYRNENRAGMSVFVEEELAKLLGEGKLKDNSKE